MATVALTVAWKGWRRGRLVVGGGGPAVAVGGWLGVHHTAYQSGCPRHSGPWCCCCCCCCCCYVHGDKRLIVAVSGRAGYVVHDPPRRREGAEGQPWCLMTKNVLARSELESSAPTASMQARGLQRGGTSLFLLVAVARLAFAARRARTGKGVSQTRKVAKRSPRMTGWRGFVTSRRSPSSTYYDTACRGFCCSRPPPSTGSMGRSESTPPRDGWRA